VFGPVGFQNGQFTRSPATGSSFSSAERTRRPSTPPRSSGCRRKPVELINQIGWPGEQNLYRLDFRMPKTSGSTAPLQLAAAWISGPTFTIPVQ